MARGCTRIAFDFEVDRTHAVVRLVTVTDTNRELILALNQIQNWKPDGEHRLGDLLEKAAEVFLDGLLPQRGEKEGVDGQLSVTLGTGPDGSLVLVSLGQATTRTMTEMPVVFPKS